MSSHLEPNPRQRATCKFRIMTELEMQWRACGYEGHSPVAVIRGSVLCSPDLGGRRGSNRLNEMQREGFVVYTVERVKGGGTETIYRIHPGPDHALGQRVQLRLAV